MPELTCIVVVFVVVLSLLGYVFVVLFENVNIKIYSNVRNFMRLLLIETV